MSMMEFHSGEDLGDFDHVDESPEADSPFQSYESSLDATYPVGAIEENGVRINPDGANLLQPTRHRRTHAELLSSNTELARCPFSNCTKSYGSATALKHHYRRKHGSTSFANQVIVDDPLVPLWDHAEIFFVEPTSLSEPWDNPKQQIPPPEPVSPAEHQLQIEKRRRKKAADLERPFGCAAFGCVKAYTTKRALRKHCEIKHEARPNNESEMI